MINTDTYTMRALQLFLLVFVELFHADPVQTDVWLSVMPIN